MRPLFRLKALSLAVVGVAHANKRGPTRRFEIAVCKPGEPVHLVPEPKNVADPHAIAVFSERGVQLGYLTAERAPWIGGMLANGRDIAAIFQSATQYGAVIRVAFDGAEPVLPATIETRDSDKADIADRDWWPDEVYPDE